MPTQEYFTHTGLAIKTLQFILEDSSLDLKCFRGLGNTLNQVKSVTLVRWVASCYQSLVNKSINGEYDDHHCDHAGAEVKLYGDDDDDDDVDQIRGGGKQVD